MNQVKIGKFIAATRKEQNMTQLELANKLGVTDRAVSKWENGRGLPELSLIKPLCDALSLSINEFFCGEKIPKESFVKQAEKTIIETFGYSKKKIRKTRRIFISAFIVLITFIIVLVSLFAVDINRMKHNRPVFFSTWGFDYTPPINLNEANIDLAIYHYLMDHGDREEKHEEDVKTFVAVHTYLLEETAASTQYNVYTWVLQEQYFLNEGQISLYGSFSMPFKFVVQKTEQGFVVTDSRFPRDGSYYTEDMKNLFPKEVRKNMEQFYKDGTYERLKLQVNKDVNLYFHQKS